VNSWFRGAARLVVGAALFLCLPVVAQAGGAPAAVPQSLRTASIEASPIPASPFYFDMSSSTGSFVTYRVSLATFQHFRLRLAATELDVHAGLLPPSATSPDEPFVAWDNQDAGAVSYLDYLSMTPGDYTLVIFFGTPASSTTSSRTAGVWVTWATAPFVAKSNIPGVPLPPGGAVGTLDCLTNVNEVYRVAVNGGQGLHLRMDPGPGSGDIDLDVFRPGWGDIYRIPTQDFEAVISESHASAGFPDLLYFRSDTPGTTDYYPRVKLWGGPQPMSYELTYRITDPTYITAEVSTIPSEYETAVVSPTLIEYGKALEVSGLLTENESPLCGQIVALETLQSDEWNVVAWSESTTDTTFPGGPPSWWHLGSRPFDLGSFAFNVYPTTNMRLNTWYPGVYWQHTPTVSAVYDLMVRAYMPKPSGPSTVYHGSTFTVSGTIKPKQASGSACPVVLKVEKRRSNGTYYVYKTVKTRGYSYSGYTKYVAKTSLPSTGTWRIRAYHPEDAVTATNGNAATYSIYRTVKAK